VLRIKTERRVGVRDSAIVVALGVEHESATVVGRGEVGIEMNRLRAIGDGAAEVAFAAVGVAVCRLLWG
jgi:hypothetical protein